MDLFIYHIFLLGFCCQVYLFCQVARHLHVTKPWINAATCRLHACIQAHRGCCFASEFEPLSSWRSLFPNATRYSYSTELSLGGLSGLGGASMPMPTVIQTPRFPCPKSPHRASPFPRLLCPTFLGSFHSKVSEKGRQHGLYAVTHYFFT